jgi:hypothetical protein
MASGGSGTRSRHAHTFDICMDARGSTVRGRRIGGEVSGGKELTHAATSSRTWLWDSEAGATAAGGLLKLRIISPKPCTTCIRRSSSRSHQRRVEQDGPRLASAHSCSAAKSFERAAVAAVQRVKEDSSATIVNMAADLMAIHL